jgi:hypothetical protein
MLYSQEPDLDTVIITPIIGDLIAAACDPGSEFAVCR